MHSALGRILLLFAIATVGGLAAAPVAPAQAPRPETEVKVTVGLGLDESPAPVEKIIGGSVRYYVSDRVSVAPEILYLSAHRGDHHLLISPNLSFDFGEPGPDTTFRPNLSVGGGVVLTRSSERRTQASDPQPEEPHTAVTPTFSVGFGFKLFVSDRVFVEPELRVGVGPAVRAGVSAGYVLTQRGFPVP